MLVCSVPIEPHPAVLLEDCLKDMSEVWVIDYRTWSPKHRHQEQCIQVLFVGHHLRILPQDACMHGHEFISACSSGTVFVMSSRIHVTCFL